MTLRTMALLCACTGAMSAQSIGDYLGPGILTRGAGTIGQRAGQDVDLRFSANATAIYDTGLQPFSIDSNGNFVQTGSMVGTEAGFGVYGRHLWRRAVLGLDYNGNYRHYPGNTFFNGTNQQLTAGYSLQKSQRLVFEFQGTGGTTSFGTNFINTLPQSADTVADPNLLLFDNRTNYVQGGMDTTFVLNSRTLITMGGNAYMVHRQSRALVGVNGYTISGSIQRRLSQFSSLGVSYQRRHYDYPRAFGESDIDQYHVNFTRQFGRSWFFSVSGGIFRAEVQGLRRVAVDPVIAALLGIQSRIETFYRLNTVPSGSVSLARQFRNSRLAFTYSRTINTGNGIFLTSQNENSGVIYSYTGLRKWSFSTALSRNSMNAIGQDLQRYQGYFGDVNVSYALTPVVHLSGGVAGRYQDLNDVNPSFRRNSNRVMFSVSFSPGNVPISIR